jgi:hypothetical protein
MPAAACIRKVGIVEAMSVRCARCGEEMPDGSRFCAACGAPLEASAGAERKLATIVFADLVGSTTLVAGHDPEDVRKALEPFFEVARRTFEEHGGSVEKYVGDAAMAVFGVPRAHGDDPDRAVAAALALVDRLAAESNRLELRMASKPERSWPASAAATWRSPASRRTPRPASSRPRPRARCWSGLGRRGHAGRRASVIRARSRPPASRSHSRRGRPAGALTEVRATPSPALRRRCRCWAEAPSSRR